MVILGFTLSERGSHLIQETLDQLHHPVRFLPQLPERSAFGSTDTSLTLNAYTVYLRCDMTNQEFEPCLLHELRHLIQYEEGFPLVCNKVHSSIYLKEPRFFSILGSTLASFLLDLDVIRWLASVGYSSEIFSPFNNDADLSSVTKSLSHLGLRDSFNMCSAVLSMYTAYARATPASKQAIYSAFSGFPEVQAEFNIILNQIDIHQCPDPQYILKTLGFIFDRYALWSVYFIAYSSLTFKTSRSLHQYLHEQNYS